MAEKGLGGGISALFGPISGESGEGGLNVPISKVEPRQDQPRTSFDELALNELADSLRRHGMIQPITVRKLDSGFFQIIAGERRWRAARIAGLTQVPIRVIEADDRVAAEMALVENLQREDLNPIEEARGFRQLMNEYGLTQDEAAQSVGKSRPAVANSLRLLSLCPDVAELVQRGDLSAGHARALLAVKDEAVQLSAAKKVVEQRLSVRQTEALAARLSKELHFLDAPAKPSGVQVDYIGDIENTLARSLGRKITITGGRSKGRIQLEFYGIDDREALIQQLMSLDRAGKA